MRAKTAKLTPLAVVLLLAGCPEDKPQQITVAPLPSEAETAAQSAASALATTSATAAITASASAAQKQAPSVNEWEQGTVVPVIGADRLGCEARILRDWYRLSCRGKNDTGGTPVAVKVYLGSDASTYTWSQGDIISVVTKIAAGRHLEARFEWTDRKHSFKLLWPAGEPRPEKLGVFGAAHPQKDGAASPEGSPSPEGSARPEGSASPGGTAFEWVKVEDGQTLPANAFVAGQAGDTKLYVCRGAHEGFTYPGRLEAGSCHVAADGQAVKLPSYEVLVGKPEAFLWVASTDGALPPHAIKGGKDKTGELYICRAEHLQGRYPGALASNVCKFVHEDKEVKGMRYEVLVTSP